MFTGAHILSGNVFEPRALNELIPNWKDEEVQLSFCSSIELLESGYIYELISEYLNDCAGTDKCWCFF